MASDDVPEPSWLPLESNPEVLNPFCARLGVPSGFGFADVFGLDEELLMMVPQPCYALCLLYPSEKISTPHRDDIRARVAAEGGPKRPDDVYFIQQHDQIGNACGTIATIHTVLNLARLHVFELNPDSPLIDFLARTEGMSCGERGWELSRETALQEMSDQTAASGETEGAGTDDAQDQHFIAFVNINGTLYELDGRTFDEEGVAFPVSHGETSEETFISDAARVIREDFMSRDPENVNFNVTAFCKLD